MSVKCYRFGAFVLDLPSMSLCGRQGAIELRPKSFNVLLYLLEHAGRLVTKDEVTAAVWADVTVTEDSLTRCISEIRRALADDAHSIIKTMSKRGYRLDVPVTMEPTFDHSSSHGHSGSIAAELAASGEVAAAKFADGLPSEVYPSPGDVTAVPPLARYGQSSLPIWGGVLVVVLGGLGWLSWPRPPKMQTSPTVPLQMMAVPTITVLPFNVFEDKAGGDRSTAGFADELRSELARAPRGYDLDIISTQDLRDTASPSGVNGLAKRVRYAVRGTTFNDGGNQRAVIRLVEDSDWKATLVGFVCGRPRASRIRQPDGRPDRTPIGRSSAHCRGCAAFSAQSRGGTLCPDGTCSTGF